MAKEVPSKKQIDKASDNEKLCEQSLAQRAQQEAVEQAKKAKEAIDEANQMLAKVPEKAIKSLTDSIELLMKTINGYRNPKSKDFNPDEVIAQLKSMLNPVISSLSSLPVPAIPGLAQISDLLNALSEMSAMNKANKKPSTPTEIPSELISTLQDLLSAIQSLCTALPLVLINLIFQMLNVIIGLFNQIAGVIGVPSIPFPLNLAPNCISMMPDIFAFALNAPGKIMNTAYGTLKKTFGTIASMQVPDAPDNIDMPKEYQPCANHDK